MWHCTNGVGISLASALRNALTASHARPLAAGCPQKGRAHVCVWKGILRQRIPASRGQGEDQSCPLLQVPHEIDSAACTNASAGMRRVLRREHCAGHAARALMRLPAGSVVRTVDLTGRKLRSVDMQLDSLDLLDSSNEHHYD